MFVQEGGRNSLFPMIALCSGSAELEYDVDPSGVVVAPEESKVVRQLRARVAELEATIAHFQVARQSNRQQQLHRSRALLVAFNNYPAI